MQSGTTKREGLPAVTKRLVIKAGSRILVDEFGRPDDSGLSRLVAGVAELHHQNHEIILVSSGAIAAGLQALGYPSRPNILPELQMAAAVGQSILMNIYARKFAESGITVGQVLLTHNDLNHRERHLNARNTIQTMLRHRVIPIVNENDVVAVDEIRFGDNDVLASMVTVLIPSDLLIILTTSDGFFQTENGRMKERVPILRNITSETLAMAGDRGSVWSSGGMASKLKAAQNAARDGTAVVIADGTRNNVLQNIISGEDTGTLILPGTSQHSLKARKKWIAYFHRPQGSLIIDDGAKDAICHRGYSLLPVGIHQSEGNFGVGSVVNIKTSDGEIIARGLTAFSRKDVELIKGRRSADIPALVGNCTHEEVIHRDNMVLLNE
jgi:glutamate 5-kinase